MTFKVGKRRSAGRRNRGYHGTETFHQAAKEEFKLSDDRPRCNEAGVAGREIANSRAKDVGITQIEVDTEVSAKAAKAAPKSSEPAGDRCECWFGDRNWR